MNIKTIKELKSLEGKKVILRTDFNVPVEKNKILDDHKIISSLRTIKYLIDNKCRIIIISHLGRPGGKPNRTYTLEPVAKELGKLLKKQIKFIPEPIGFAVGSQIADMGDGDVTVLENMRFYKEELEDDRNFSRELASYGDIYVNDAFAVSHRAHASLSSIKEALPFYAGFLVEEELLSLNRILKPKKPMVTIIGGAKIKTKLPLIEKFMHIADQVLVGGILANIFLSSRGYSVGSSPVDKQDIKIAKKIKSDKIILPIDLIVSNDKNGKTDVKRRKLSEVKEGDYVFDIGPETIKLYSSFIKKAETLVWNGPLGWFERDHFKHGTISIARIFASRSRGRAFGVAGGGETVEAIKQTKMQGYIDWVSTGGGAMLDYLGNVSMPGLIGLIKK